MNRMRERLERALKQGLVLSAAVVGCSSEQIDDGNGNGATGGQAGKGSVIPVGAGKAGSTNEPGGEGGTAIGGEGGVPGQGLLPYPQHDYPLCSGQNYGGESNPYGGQCCVTAQCFTPTSGECPAADEVGLAELSDFPPGSGSCGCLPESGKFVEGPFAPRSDAQPSTSGSCCYLVAAIGCTGRPLLVAGAPRVAGATRRADWTSRPSWV